MSDDPSLSTLRAELAGVDRKLVEAVNRRIELVLAIKERKAGLGVPFVDAGQEQRVHDALLRSSRGPLTADGLRDLVRAVLALSRSEAARAQARRRDRVVVPRPSERRIALATERAPSGSEPVTCATAS